MRGWCSPEAASSSFARPCSVTKWRAPCSAARMSDRGALDPVLAQQFNDRCICLASCGATVGRQDQPFGLQVDLLIVFHAENPQAVVSVERAVLDLRAVDVEV